MDIDIISIIGKSPIKIKILMPLLTIINHYVCAYSG